MSEQGFDLSGRKLFIAIPAYDYKVSLKQATSLAKFAQDCLRYGIQVNIGSICGCSVVSRARNLLVKQFLDSDAEELLFIDADINFEPDAILRVMARLKPGFDILGAVPRTRDGRKRYISNMYFDDDECLEMTASGLVRMNEIATAFMLIRREVIETMVAATPERNYHERKVDGTINCLFDFKLQNNEYTGEDFLFCANAREQGFKIWIDPNITLGHMGVQEFVGNFQQDILSMMEPKIVEGKDGAKVQEVPTS